MLRSSALPFGKENSSANDGYNFDFSSTIIVYVALAHLLEINHVSTDGSVRPIWSLLNATWISQEAIAPGGPAGYGRASWVGCSVADLVRLVSMAT